MRGQRRRAHIAGPGFLNWGCACVAGVGRWGWFDGSRLIHLTDWWLQWASSGGAWALRWGEARFGCRGMRDNFLDVLERMFGSNCCLNDL